MPRMGLTAGELFVVAFITLAVLSAAWWPRFGEALMVAISGGRGTRDRTSGSGQDGVQGE
jgi:hypothetical protein